MKKSTSTRSSCEGTSHQGTRVQNSVLKEFLLAKIRNTSRSVVSGGDLESGRMGRV